MYNLQVQLIKKYHPMIFYELFGSNYLKCALTQIWHIVTIFECTLSNLTHGHNFWIRIVSNFIHSQETKKWQIVPECTLCQIWHSCFRSISGVLIKIYTWFLWEYVVPNHIILTGSLKLRTGLRKFSLFRMTQSNWRVP